MFGCSRISDAKALVSGRGGRALAGGSLRRRRLGSTACLCGALLDLDPNSRRCRALKMAGIVRYAAR